MASEAVLASAVHEVADAFEANELFQRNGWTDGLPIVPPTEAGVRAFLYAAGLEADHVLGVEPVRRRRITAEKVAIAAVMAGCLPEYMPVVTAVIRAMCEPQFGLHGSTASTGGSAPMIIVNGPVCSCGRNGCLEALASGTAVAREAIGRIRGGRQSILTKMTGNRIENITAEQVNLAAKDGDELAREIIDQAAYYLGIGVTNLVNIFNPEVVIIGGSMADMGDLLLQPVRAMVAEKAFPLYAQTVEIVPAQLGNDAGLFGAAIYALEQ